MRRRRLHGLLVSLAVLLAALPAFAQLPQATISGTLYKPDGSVASGVRISLLKAIVSGQLVSLTALPPVVTGSTGTYSFTVPRNSTITVYANVTGLSTSTGAPVNLVVPNGAGPYDLKDLASVAAVPTSGMTVKVAGVALNGKIGTLDFLSGASITQTPTGEANITIAGGGSGGGAGSLDELSDVVLDSPLSAQFLRYNGTEWANSSILAADLPSAIDAIKIGNGLVSNAEFAFLDGASSNLQTQITARLTQAAADALYAALSHGHSIANVTGLQGALDAKAASSHGHIIGDVSGLQAALDSKSATGHGHVIGDTSGLQAALDAKLTQSAADLLYAGISHNHSGVYEPANANIQSHISNTSNPHSVTKSQVGLSAVENTALSTWAGSANITSLGTVATGTWQGAPIADSFISNAAAWNAKQDGDADLSAIAGLSPSNDDIIQRKAGAWANRTVAQFKTDLSLTKSDVGLGNVLNVAQEPAIAAGTTAQYWRGDKSWQTLDKAAVGLSNLDNVQQQPLHANLTALAGLTSAADKAPYFTGTGAAALFDLTSYGRSLVAVANESAFKALVNLEAGVDYQAFNQNLADLAGLADPNADRLLFWDDSAGVWTHLTLGTNLSITGTTINAAGGATGATVALDNLASPAVNLSLLPGTTNTIDLGSTSKQWRDGYIAGVLHLGQGYPNGVQFDSGTLLYAGSGNFTFYDFSQNNARLGNVGLTLASNRGLGWTSGTDATQAKDTEFVRYTAGVSRLTDGSGGLGKFLSGRVVTAKTSNYSIAVADSFTFFTNTGAGAGVNFTLPTAAVGLTYEFYRDTNQTVTVTAGASTTIRVGTSVTASAGNVTLDAVGSRLRLVAISTTQWVGDVSGTATFN